MLQQLRNLSEAENRAGVMRREIFPAECKQQKPPFDPMRSAHDNFSLQAISVYHPTTYKPLRIIMTVGEIAKELSNS